MSGMNSRSWKNLTVAAPTPVIVLTPHSAVQSGICLLICPAHPGSDLLGNEQQAGRNPPDRATDSPVVRRHSGRGLKRIQLLRLSSAHGCETQISPLFAVLSAAMCFVFCQVSSVFDSQLKILHRASEAHQSSVSSEMEKRVRVYTLTKCLGIVSAQHISKHCPPVWTGAANLCSSALIAVNWWPGVFAVLWKHAWADTSNTSAVMNDPRKCNHSPWPHSQSALLCLQLKRRRRGKTWCFAHSCVCEPVLGYPLHAQSWSGPLNRQMSFRQIHLLMHFKEPVEALSHNLDTSISSCFGALKADVIFSWRHSFF